MSLRHPSIRRARVLDLSYRRKRAARKAAANGTAPVYEKPQPQETAPEVGNDNDPQSSPAPSGDGKSPTR